MLCRHIKKNEVFNLVIYTDKDSGVITEYYKIDIDNDFKTLPGNMIKVGTDIFIKKVTFDTIGEYIVKVINGENTEYERFKVYDFSDEDENAKLNQIILSLEDMNSVLNEELLFIKKQLRIINAQL